MRGRDRAGGLTPGRPEPGGRVEAGRIEVVQGIRTAGGDLAQHGVDQAGERRETAAFRQVNRGADSGMHRRFQQQQPGGTDAQDLADGFRRLLAQEGLQHCVQRAHAAQHGRGEAMCSGSVPGFQGRQRAQRFLQRAMAFQDGGQQIESGFACRIGHQTAGRPIPW